VALSTHKQHTMQLTLVVSTVVSVVLCIVACCCSAALTPRDPPTPRFPSEFRTVFDLTVVDNRTGSLGDWEFSADYQAERWNHNFKHFETIISILRRYDLGKQYHVTVNKGQPPRCLTAPLSGKLETPDFAGWKYSGSEVVEGGKVDDWTNGTAKYQDYTPSQIPFELRDPTFSMRFRKFNPVKPPEREFYPPAACNHTIARAPTSPLTGCSLIDKLKCAGVVALCAVACCAGGCAFDPGCISCMGAAYNECKDCF